MKPCFTLAAFHARPIWRVDCPRSYRVRGRSLMAASLVGVFERGTQLQENDWRES